MAARATLRFYICSELRLKHAITIIGAGKVGRTLGYLLHRLADVTIVDVVHRSLASAQSAVDFIGAGRPCDSIEQVHSATIYLMTVPDDQIAACCDALVRTGRIGGGTIVMHCSGALAASALHGAVGSGASVASIHPIRSFADPRVVVTSFAGTFCGVEGDPVALALLGPLFQALGARLVQIRADAKNIYHAAAVFASNYVVSLLATAQQAYEAAGIAPELALAMLAPLTQEALDNVVRCGPAMALTGPIARGDRATVARQQRALEKWDSDAGALYATLADATWRLAARRVETS